MLGRIDILFGSLIKRLSRAPIPGSWLLHLMLGNYCPYYTTKYFFALFPLTLLGAEYVSFTKVLKCHHFYFLVKKSRYS